MCVDSIPLSASLQRSVCTEQPSVSAITLLLLIPLHSHFSASLHLPLDPQFACAGSHTDVVRLLLEAGADIYATSNDKGNAMDYAEGETRRCPHEDCIYNPYCFGVFGGTVRRSREVLRVFKGTCR